MRVTSLMPRFVAAAFAISLAVTVQAAAPVKFSASAGEVRDFIAVSASVGYAGTMGGGLWKTSDAGANWFKATLPAKTVWKVSANAASGGVRL